MAKTNIGLRVDPELLTRLDALAEALTLRAEGTEVTRTDAARTALTIGVEELETRLGIKRGKSKPSK